MRSKTYIGVLNEEKEIVYVVPLPEDIKEGKVAKLLDLGWEWADWQNEKVLKKEYYRGIVAVLVKLFPNGYYSYEFSALVNTKEDVSHEPEWSYW